MVEATRKMVKIHRLIAEQIGHARDNRGFLPQRSAPRKGNQCPHGCDQTVGLLAVLRGEPKHPLAGLVKVGVKPDALPVPLALIKAVVPMNRCQIVQKPHVAPGIIGRVAGERAAKPVDAVVDFASLAFPTRQIPADVRVLFKNFAVQPVFLSVNSCGKSRNAAADDNRFHSITPF